MGDPEHHPVGDGRGRRADAPKGGKQSAGGRVGAAAPAPTAAAPRTVLAGTVRPKAFGTQDYTITVLSALSFRSHRTAGIDPVTFSLLCCVEFGTCSSGVHFYAGLELPAGAVIDYIGVNTATTVFGAMGFTLHFRDHLGGSAPLASATLPTHVGGGFFTDYAGPLGILIPDQPRPRVLARRRDRHQVSRIRSTSASSRSGGAGASRTRRPRRLSPTCRTAIPSISSSRPCRPRASPEAAATGRTTVRTHR